MATRSSISMQLEDGKCRTIYCHNDGYPSYNGRVLKTHYTDKNKVEELIELGDISFLEVEVSPPSNESHSFDQPLKGITVAYHRDRGEEKTNARLYESFKNIREDSVYDYLFVNGEWFLVENGSLVSF